ncbi:MAG: CarD family transcriptional regulator [Clostridiales bacterium]|nr:CarD family transcriptional regulator [Clostridiales bacterium]
MFEAGDLIVYGSEGVCRVESVGHPEISSLDRERTYYTLAPLYRDGIIYTPVDTVVFMRPVISKEDAETLIGQIPAIRADLEEPETPRELTDRYKAAVKSNRCEDLVQLIKTVYSKRIAATQKGRKLGQIDEQYMKRAEDMLHGELAVVLGIEKEDVPEYIRTRVE